METKKFFTSLNFSLPVDQDELDLINENFEEVTNDTEKMSFKKYFFKLHSKALSVVKPNISKKEDLEKIQSLEAEITRISVLLDNKSIDENSEVIRLQNIEAEVKILTDDKEALQLIIDSNDEEIETLKNRVRELQGREPEQVTVEKEIKVPIALSENQIIVNFSPIEKDIINLVARSETKRSLKSVTPELILKDMFNLYITKGACDFFRRPPKDEIVKIKNNHKPPTA